MKIIQIRGSNGSGKTTTVKQFVERNNLHIEEIFIKGKKTFITTNDKHSIVVLGRYDKNIGGCDLFDNKEHVFNTILYVVTTFRPEIIIFEGLIYSFTYKFASNLSDYMKNYKYSYQGICLYIPIEVALERIYIRNGGKPIKEDYIITKTKTLISSYRKLLSNGYNVKMVDTSKIEKENMYKILENEL